MRQVWIEKARQGAMTAEQMTQAIRAEFAAAISELEGMRCLRTKHLTIAIPDGCEAGLETKLSAHNGRVAKFLSQREKSIDLAASLPALVDSDKTAAEIVADSQAARGAPLEVARRHYAMLQERKALLADVLAFLAGRKDQAQQKLDAVVAKVGKALKAAGYKPEDDPIHKHLPGSAEIRFNHRVADSADVRAATAAVNSLSNQVRNINQQIEDADADAPLLYGIKLAAFAELAGLSRWT